MQKVELLTPIGRLVQGSLYVGNTIDIDGRPLMYKSGANIGKPRTNFFFAIAIEKKGEQHWNQTEWGAKIWAIGQAGFPNGQYMSPTFAWKVKDGDSTVPNREGVPPCQIEGFPGHWVLNFSSDFAPSLYTDCGNKQLLDADAIKLGDYIQVYGSVADNESAQQPGVYLNHQMVCFFKEGKRIYKGANPKTVGFGGAMPINIIQPELLNTGFNPGTTIPNTGVAISPTTVPNSAPAQGLIVGGGFGVPASLPSVPPPHYGILSPKKLMMLPTANGVSYEQYKSAGWSDEQLIASNLARYE